MNKAARLSMNRSVRLLNQATEVEVVHLRVSMEDHHLLEVDTVLLLPQLVDRCQDKSAELYQSNSARMCQKRHVESPQDRSRDKIVSQCPAANVPLFQDSSVRAFPDRCANRLPRSNVTRFQEKSAEMFHNSSAETFQDRSRDRSVRPLTTRDVSLSQDKSARMFQDSNVPPSPESSAEMCQDRSAEPSQDRTAVLPQDLRQDRSVRVSTLSSAM